MSALVRLRHLNDLRWRDGVVGVLITGVAIAYAPYVDGYNVMAIFFDGSFPAALLVMLYHNYRVGRIVAVLADRGVRADVATVPDLAATVIRRAFGTVGGVSVLIAIFASMWAVVADGMYQVMRSSFVRHDSVVFNLAMTGVLGATVALFHSSASVRAFASKCRKEDDAHPLWPRLSMATLGSVVVAALLLNYFVREYVVDEGWAPVALFLAVIAGWRFAAALHKAGAAYGQLH